MGRTPIWCFSFGPLEIFHRDERFAVFLAEVVNGADVGMIERRSGLRFTLETAQRLRIAGDFVGKEFQRHEAVQARVLGFVNHTHAAAAEFFENAVMRNGLPDHWPRILRWEER
jgi:hypothetical protein